MNSKPFSSENLTISVNVTLILFVQDQNFEISLNLYVLKPNPSFYIHSHHSVLLDDLFSSSPCLQFPCCHPDPSTLKYGLIQT